ncbi:hypothetical protein OGAPHI_003152 [Ogataea philodendri]|uniref:Amino acid transporter transmembrane domain-containing protein n=1 Tax=Ogataea philodendri TaxID=1378263 RepID=A0A9P8T5Y6_9ASCO|nr:uncharacterized protein OGAPHI_003152 [Ogataea philodendri]KAH3667503.1 hypothetical protein OGAPHI_003152 [Ogataea philodendri]
MSAFSASEAYLRQSSKIISSFIARLMTAEKPVSKTIHEVSVEEVSSSKSSPIVKRLFYAQRYIEHQYSQVKHQQKFSWWNRFIYGSLKIESLVLRSEDYPTWSDDALSIRNSHWLSCAGLITTEIMGALLVPQGVSYLGYVPGNIMLVVFFSFTLVAGGIIWWLFLLFDSPEFPVKTFADIAELLGGKIFRETIIFLQMVAMILTAATIVIGAVEGLEIMRTERVCFTGLILLICGVQAACGHLKSLSKLGIICIAISILNYVCLFAQLGYFGEPNWENAKSVLGVDRGTVHAYAVAHQGFVAQLVSVTSLSYVFAGCLVFPEILSEMKRPWDFWKSMLLAQSCILVIYLLYGNFVYAKQGQFTNSPAVLGISDTAALRGFAMVTFLTGYTQGTFYGHLSAKVCYKNYLPRLVRNLRFQSLRGTLLWSATVICVWVVVFVISAGVPNVMAVAAFTSALTMIPLTYVFPYLLNLWAVFVKASVENIGHYDPATGETHEYEAKFKQLFKNGYKSHRWQTWVLLSISAVASIFAVMGIAGSIGYMVFVFSSTAARSFSCKSPI